MKLYEKTMNIFSFKPQILSEFQVETNPEQKVQILCITATVFPNSVSAIHYRTGIFDKWFGHT